MTAARWTSPLPAFLSAHAEHPLMFRPASTDARVFDQVFVEREYACLDEITAPDVVIDCGANVGYSSAYFLSRFSSCHVAAIEPDAGNFAVLAANMAPYGDRVTLFDGAVWPESCALHMTDPAEPYRGGGEWARQVSAHGGGRPVRAFTIPEVMEAMGVRAVDLIKVDIEGAEVELFARETEWIEAIDCLAIEIHDDSRFGEATPVVHGALAGAFTARYSGELTVFERSSAPANG